MAGKRPTLADVASHARTSTAVVSYVLNDGPRPVSRQLRARVVAALDELGYRPDRRAQALRRPRRWGQLGLLVPDLEMPLFAAFAGQIEREARAREHLTMIGNTGFDPGRELDFAGEFCQVGIDGLVVVGAVDRERTAALCTRERIPLVWVHNVRGGTEQPVVGSDHVRCGRLATLHLLEEHSCRNVVFVGGFTPEDVAYGDRETVEERSRGFTSVAGDGATIVRTDLTPAGAYAAVRELYRSTPPPGPDGLVVGTLAQAAAAMRAVTDVGCRIPEDVQVVGFDGTDSDFGQLTLTSMQQPIGDITRRAIDRLLSDPSTPAPEPEDDAGEEKLRVGESCGCRRLGEPAL